MLALVKRPLRSTQTAMQLDHSNRRLPSNDCFKAVIVLTLTGMSLAGCITLGEDFALENAIKVKNGMTREQEIAVMGSDPSPVEGTDEGKLTWIYSWANPVPFGT